MRRGAGVALAAVVQLSVACPPARAWNDFGHMVAAYAAWERLTPSARRRVDALLARHPEHAEWRRHLPRRAGPAADEALVFMQASTWADDIKRDPRWVDDGPHGGNRPEGSPAPDRNTGFGDRLRHRYWHFIDVPFSDDGTALPRVPSPNVQTQIRAFRRVLASDADDALKSYDLVWLLHLVADAHQPLHCASRVTRTRPDGDAGGNAEEVRWCPTAACVGTLHRYWDERAGTGRWFSDVVAFARALPSAADAAATSDEAAWIAESHAAAKRVVYAPPIARGDGPFTLTDDYAHAARALARQRLALAAARLAAMLNDELR
jgi:hypothetical protein